MTYRLENITRGGTRGYRADIVVGGKVVGYVERADRPTGGGYRAASYKAIIDGRIVATGDTLAELRYDLLVELNENPTYEEANW